MTDDTNLPPRPVVLRDSGRQVLLASIISESEGSPRPVPKIVTRKRWIALELEAVGLPAGDTEIEAVDRTASVNGVPVRHVVNALARMCDVHGDRAARLAPIIVAVERRCWALTNPRRMIRLARR